MSLQKSYRNPTVTVPVTFVAGLSNAIDLTKNGDPSGDNGDGNVTTSNTGTTQIRRISFKPGWVAANVTFRIYGSASDATNDTNGYGLSFSDCTDASQVIIPIAAALVNITITLPPQCFDSVVFLRILSSVAQPGGQVCDLTCFPIYQIDSGV